MTDAPSLLAWLTLLASWIAIGIGAVASERSKTADPADRAPRRGLPVAPAVVAGLLPLAAYIAGGPWSAVVWWALAAVPTTVVLSAVFITALGAAGRWPLDNASIPVRTRILLAGATALIVAAISVTLSLLLALGSELELSAALSLLAGYLAWQAVRVWTSGS
jgi:hypothetical protein